MLSKNNISIYSNDLPNDLAPFKSMAIDTEAMGLNYHRDRLCVVQIADDNGQIYVVKFDGHDYSAPNLKRILSDPKSLKIFHFARFDVAIIYKYLGILVENIYCTKIASKIARTYTDSHGLKELCRELLGIQISKTQQSSDWGNANLSADQIKYAATDVVNLHEIMHILDKMLSREQRTDLAVECFRFLPHRVLLDVRGWAETDIFAHH